MTPVMSRWSHNRPTCKNCTMCVGVSVLPQRSGCAANICLIKRKQAKPRKTPSVRRMLPVSPPGHCVARHQVSFSIGVTAKAVARRSLKLGGFTHSRASAAQSPSEHVLQRYSATRVVAADVESHTAHFAQAATAEADLNWPAPLAARGHRSLAAQPAVVASAPVVEVA